MTRSILITTLALFLISCTSQQIQQTMDIVSASGAAKSLTPSNQEVSLGLKEALKVGIERGANKVAGTGGFLNNSLIKIPFPPAISKVDSTLRKVGLSSISDEGIKLLNRAAESAAKESIPVFASAISNMSVNDAMGILLGNNPHAATDYLKKTTSNQLMENFTPVIKKHLDKVNATKHWANIFSRYNTIPFVEKVNPDITNYVTNKAVSGLFTMVAKEEQSIRKDPVARASSLMKKVFGYADSKKQ